MTVVIELEVEVARVDGPDEAVEVVLEKCSLAGLEVRYIDVVRGEE